MDINKDRILYNFDQFVGHASQPILADNGNKFFSILAGFGDLSDKFKKSHVVTN